ncbi:hypothetical protein EDD16DRAFT_1521058 [Pisolithus croceorrhizus]|nr:hypothetical protein EDD16DRAFT_1521058 [Pisolithus croceorrhizus]
MKTLVNPSPLSSPTKQSRSPSKHQFLSKDGVDNVFDMNYPPVEPMRLPRKKAATGYQIQQWTVDFFKDSALHMTGLLLHLGHDGAPCPSASANVQATTSEHMQPVGMDEGDGKTLTTFPSTFIPQWVQKSYHMQLFHTKLYPSTFERPSTAFTFLVLDDFLRDNVECGTSGINYYSKLCQVTSSVFPHLIADQYQELLQVAQQWHLLKLLKWSGFQDDKNGSTKGDLALFCAACPQPRINLSPQANLDHWRYTRTVVMDRNFKVEHMYERRCDDQVWLMDRHSFMVSNLQYQEYIEATPHITEKSACNNHKVISQASASHRKLNSTGVGATACMWHGCFYPHSVVDFQKGERQLNMDYSLCNALSYNMNGIQNVICFYDINCTYMKNLQKQVDKTMFLEISPSLRIMAGIGMWHVHRHKKECYVRYSPLFIKGSGWVNGEIIETLWSTLNIVSASTRGMTSLHHQELLDFQMNDSNFMKMIWMISSLSWKVKAAEAAVSLARESFERLNQAVLSSQQKNWQREEEAALNEHICNPSVMDIFEIQLTKAPTVHGVELHLLQTSTSNDRVAAEWTTFIADGRIYLQMDTTLDGSEEFHGSNQVASKNVWVDDDKSPNGGNSNCSGDDMPDTDTFTEQTPSSLPLPSNLGADKCRNIGVHQLAEMELELHIAQANDVLHGLCLALADKVVIFRDVVRTTMIALQLSPEVLNWYLELQKSHLATKSTGSILKLARIVGKRKKNC